MNPSNQDIEGIPHVYLSKYLNEGSTYYRLHVAMQLPEGETFAIEQNEGRFSEQDADYYVLNVSEPSGTPQEKLVLADFKDEIEKVKDKIAVVVYYSNAPQGQKAKKKVKISYSDADEGGSGGGI